MIRGRLQRSFSLGLCALACVIATPAAVAGDGAKEMREARHEGRSVAYLDTGAPEGDGADATPLVLIHGWASDHRAWFKQRDTLSEDRRLLIVDLPAHGGSGDVEGEHSMALYADAVAAVMDDAGVEKSVVVGHSNGTPVARVFATRHPDRLAALVAVDGALVDAFPPGVREQFLEQIKGPQGEQLLEQAVAQLGTTMKRPEDAERVRQMFEDSSHDTRIRSMVATLDPTILEGGPIDAPILLVEAPNPMLWTEQYHERVRALSDDVRVERMQDVSHFLMVDDPDGFREVLLAFLDERAL